MPVCFHQSPFEPPQMAVINGPAWVHGWPMVTLPPYGHTVKGNGGLVTGAGNPRNLGAGPLLPEEGFQSSLYALMNLLMNPAFGNSPSVRSDAALWPAATSTVLSGELANPSLMATNW